MSEFSSNSNWQDLSAFLGDVLLQRRLKPAVWSWWQQRFSSIPDATDRDLQITFGLIPRKTGKTDLQPDEHELRAVEGHRPGLDIRRWSVDVTARIALMHRVAMLAPEQFADRFVAFCQTADLAESVALYTGIAIYPRSSALDHQVGEGLRSNITAVFESIAHYNPFPAETFDEHRWNQMVLKALFIGSRLDPVQGIDRRANVALADLLCGYARERRLANRSINPELWRGVAPFATGKRLAELRRACDNGSDNERAGAILALSQSESPEAKAAMDQYPEHRSAIAEGTLDWQSISEQLDVLPPDQVGTGSAGTAELS